MDRSIALYLTTLALGAISAVLLGKLYGIWPTAVLYMLASSAALAALFWRRGE